MLLSFQSALSSWLSIPLGLRINEASRVLESAMDAGNAVPCTKLKAPSPLICAAAIEPSYESASINWCVAVLNKATPSGAPF